MSTQPVAFGCFKLSPDKNTDHCADAIAGAIHAGYTILDFASAYGTHAALPLALKKIEVPYEGEVHSKITLKDIREKGCKGAVKAVLEELELPALDVLYLHAPDAISQDTLDQLQVLKKEETIKNIGLSNVALSQLQGLEKNKGFRPDYVQVEISPMHHDDTLIRYCVNKGIKLVGYRPLGEGRWLNIKELTRIAAELSGENERVVTVAQVIHRWLTQKGVVPLTKSVSHQEENIKIDDFSLTDNQIRTIDSLTKSYRQSRTCVWEKFVKEDDLEKVNNWINDQ